MSSTNVTRRQALAEAPPSVAAGARLGLVVAFVTLLVLGTDLFIASPLLPDIGKEYDISAGMAGNSVTAFSVAYIIGAPTAGALTYRVGPRTVLVLGLAGFALGNLLTAMSPWFWMLLVVRILAGFCAAAVTPTILSLVGQVAPAERRGVWMSTVIAGFLIALTTGAPLGTFMAERWGWKAPFLAIAVASAVLIAANRITWRSAASPAGQAAGSAGDKLPLSTKLRAVGVTGFWSFAVYCFYTYLGTALEEDAHFSTGMIATTLAVFGVGAVVGSFGGGALADRFGQQRIAVLSLLLLSAALVLIDLTLTGPKWVLIAVLCLFALVAYPCLPAHQSRLVHTFPQHHIGSMFAWDGFFMYLGTSIGAAIGSVLITQISFESIPVVCAVVGVLGAFFYRAAFPRSGAPQSV
ncbi:MFS transporter [Streptomyces sp. NPDC096205]|uniref:MFS transporter n=1 Tax=Streptomyces sp. NPDC096205 TaxID=3366081 RepID=UPI0038300B5A